MGRAKAKQIRIRFLQDKPADEDFFGTHRELAQAVASALASNPELRTIGLLGKWGSGKSTVLKELQKEIGRSVDLSDIQIFTFDAWEHQGEPIRRAFLESLFNFLTEKELIEPAKWQADIDLLSGRLGVTENIETPELTQPARQILWSLTLIPLGLALFGLDSLREGLGQTTTMAGQAALFVALMCFAVPVIFIAEHLLLSRPRKSAAKVEATPANSTSGTDEVIGLIINKRVNRVKTRTIKSPEPTAIDFSATCNQLIVDVKSKKTRLLCVVDNLDRLPADDALEMWSAIRAIFANIQADDVEQTHPFVLVPMDHSALLASFGSKGDDERAKSFIDKTFDLTFRVPPPVRSDWKDFLRSQMEKVFGSPSIDQRIMYFVEKVLDSKHKTANDVPTPRIINRFVNSLAAAWLSREHDNFPLPVVALSVSNSEEIESSVLQFTQRDDLRFFDSDYPEWRDQIVALYFGVPKAKSRQVLLEGPLRRAIEETDTGKFQALMKYPGAFKVFDDAVTTYAYDAADTNSQEFAFKSATLLETVRGHEEPVRRIWRFLVDRIVESLPLPSLSELDRKLAPFLKALSAKQFAKLTPTAVSWLSRHASSVDDRDSFTLIAQVYDLIRKRAPGEIPKIALSGDAIPVINAIYWTNGNEVLEGSTNVEEDLSKLVPELATLVTDEDQAVVVPEVLAFRQRFPSAFPAEKTFTLAPLRDASVAVMETASAPLLTRFAAQNLGMLARITKKSEDVADAVIDAGHLQMRLKEAIAANDQETVGVLAALAIARGKPFSAEAGNPRDAKRLSSMEAALNSFVSNPLNSLWNAEAAGNSPVFIEKALEHIIREREFSTQEFDQISANLDFYFKPLNKAARHALARKIGEDPKRVEKIGRLVPSGVFVDILTPWLRSGVPDAERQCKNTVGNLPSESWRSYLEGSGDWVFSLLEKCPEDFKLTLNSKALEAAVELIDERSATLSTSERAKLRKLVSHFNVHAERKLIDAVIAHVPSNNRNALMLIKALSDETAASISSHLRSEGLVRLLDGLSLISPGRVWLDAHTDALHSAIKRFDRSSKKLARDWFRKTKTEKPTARANWVEMMGHRLGFDR